MNKSISVGKIFGIQFRIHFSWFITFALVTFSLVYPYFTFAQFSPSQSQWQYWVAAIVTSLLIFASVIVHELAHSLVGKANGVTTNNITLFIFGGVAEMASEPSRPTSELKMAIAGPLSSLLLSGVFGLLWFLFFDSVFLVIDMLFRLVLINLALAVFNLIPGFPLDGGRVFRSLLWRFSGNYCRSTRIATRLGQAIGYLFILGGGLLVLLRPVDLSWFDGLWLILIGWFLARVASISYRQIRWQEAMRQSSSLPLPIVHLDHLSASEET